MATKVNSLDYGEYRYRVGDTIKISPSMEYMYIGISPASPNRQPGISGEVRRITAIWKQEAVGSVVLNPIATEWVSGSTKYGGGYIRPQQIVVGSGGLKIKHYVTYNANGGTGAPGKQTKMYGSTLKLSTTKPTRTGYTFVKWNTNTSGTGTSYNPGGSYTSDSNVTLYAIWKANTWPVSYNANGGTGAPSKQTKTYGVTLKLSSTKPTRPNYNFVGWGISSGSTSVVYAPGANYTKNASITLYAIWSLAYTKPRISSLKVDRCKSDGVISDDGTYAKVQFKWACDKSVTAIEIRWGSSKISVSASGTSGSVSKVINGSFDVETAYTITAYVADANGNNTATTQLSPMFYIMDILNDGKGIAFGKPADSVGSGYADFGMPILLRANKNIHGQYSRGDIGNILELNSSNNIHIGSYAYSVGPNNANKPVGDTYLNGGNNIYIRTHKNIKLESKLGGYVTLGAHSIPTCIYKNGYWGIARPDGSDSGWFRATQSGIIPYSGGVGNVGSATWPFVGVYADKFYRATNKPIDENRLLWQGAIYMAADQSATLAESWNDQMSGIILAFSRYTPSTGTAENHNWNLFYLPKDQLNRHRGGYTFPIGHNPTLNYFASKYLYFDSGKVIKGHADNTKNGTAESGVKYNNQYFVLRYVYGV